jgi:pimeloyl-ACP methyl ester carboxylesterase
MLLVRHRLRKEYHFRAEMFGYPSMRRTLDENAHSLAEHIGKRQFDSVHLVGHSLGGVVALRMLALHPDTPVGRVVCLGSPLRGSRSATRLRKKRWGRRMVGNSVKAGVIDESADSWSLDACRSFEIGVIAGTLPMGLGRVLGRFSEDSDGTVAVSETRLPGLKDHLCMPVSHSGLAVSRDVTDQVAAFLMRGEFLRE